MDTRGLRFGLLSLLVTLAACRPDSPSSSLNTSDVNGSPAMETSADSRETWDLMTLNGQPVGYQVTTMRESQENGRLLHETTAKSELNVQRFGQSTSQQMELVSRETAEGQLREFSCTTSSGPQPIRTHGIRQGNVLEVTMFTEGNEKSWSIPVPERCGGLFAIEHSLLREPLQPGETRSIQAVIPVLNVIGTIQLWAQQWESTELLQGTRRLLRIDSQLGLPNGDAVDSRMWSDDQGQIHKSEIPALQQVTYRVDRATALKANRHAVLDLADVSLVPVQPALDAPHQTRRIRYRAQLSHGDPSRVFRTGSSQTVRRLDEQTAEITVLANGPAAPLPARPEEGPTEADRQPSPWIQSDDPTVRSLAREAVGKAQDPAEQALAIESFVHEALTQKDFSTAFATAAEVARSRSGDCTEHAVLTAALCRAQGLPARVVVGLVYVQSKQAFAFHMWNTVWIGDRWVPLDATLGRGGTGAAHLGLSDSALDAGQSLTSFLPVIQVLGQLKLEILEVNP